MMLTIRRFVAGVAVAAIGVTLYGQQLSLPLRADSVRFAVIGDMGTGDAPQYEVGAMMETWRRAFPFQFVIMLGDNIYGGSGLSDVSRKFELPYKALLDAGVEFYASLGNHDSPSQRGYKPFHMNGQSYYTYRKGNAQFFVLDSNYLDPRQVAWLEKELQGSSADWKICYFHHALFSSAAFHGSAFELRLTLEPLFVKYGVQVVFAGRDHVYERTRPQKGVSYFVEGASGKLRKGNLKAEAEMTAAGYDQDLSFMLIEIAGDAMRLQTVPRAGKTADSGTIPRAVPLK